MTMTAMRRTMRAEAIYKSESCMIMLHIPDLAKVNKGKNKLHYSSVLNLLCCIAHTVAIGIHKVITVTIINNKPSSE